MTDDLFAKLEAQESDFLKSEFLSPVLNGMPIRVKIGGVVLTLKLKKKFEGWGIFKPLSFKEAKYVRKPSITERQEYLNLFPELRFILTYRDEKVWYGVPSHSSDRRFQISGIVPLYLAEEVEVFDVVSVRFDGQICWYDKPYEKYSFKNSTYLKESLAELLEPEKLSLSGLTQEEKSAYLIAYGASEEAKKTKAETRIKDALYRSGAKFKSYKEREDSYTIKFTVDGSEHTSVVNKDNLRVQSAGICLSGGDSNFDLQSLVGVIREGQDRHAINRVGNDMNGWYWQTYGRRRR